MKILKNPKFKKGLEILKRYEPEPFINEMGDGEYYVGDMNIWENKITNDELKVLEKLGFEWYDNAECLLFTEEGWEDYEI
jgi:hypothetical protein